MAVRSQALAVAVSSRVPRLSAAFADERVRLLALLFALGQLCDAITTHVALASGRYQEANAVFAGALAQNEALSLLAKLAVAGAVLLVAATRISPRRRLPLLVALAALSLQAPLSNVLQMLGVY